MQWTRAYLRINSKYGAARADIFRLAFTYVNGGMWLDAMADISYGGGYSELYQRVKTCCGGSMVPFVVAGWGDVNKHMGALDVVAKFGRGEVINGFFMTAPGNPIIKRCLDQIVANIDDYDDKYIRCGVSKSWLSGTIGRYAVLNTTGPYSNTKVMLPLLPNCPHLYVPHFKNLGISFYGSGGHVKHIKDNGNNLGDVSNIHYTNLSERLVVARKRGDFTFGGADWWEDTFETIHV